MYGFTKYSLACFDPKKTWGYRNVIFLCILIFGVGMDIFVISWKIFACKIPTSISIILTIIYYVKLLQFSSNDEILLSFFIENWNVLCSCVGTPCLYSTFKRANIISKLFVLYKFIAFNIGKHIFNVWFYCVTT